MIQDQFRLDPLDKGTLFLFCGRRSDRIKGLFFEGDGYLLLYKRLAPGYRFHWPRNEQEARELTQIWGQVIPQRARYGKAARPALRGSGERSPLSTLPL